MAKWGDGAVWGAGALWGTVTLDSAGEALAGQSPAFPARQVPWRRACSEIHTFNPETWTDGVPLLYVMSGASRTASRAGVGFEQQTLSFQVSKAEYYLAGGDGAGLLDKGAWLCVRRTVTTPTGTTTFTDGVFRLDTAPSVEGADEGATLRVTAVDWAQPLLAPARGNGWVSYPGLISEMQDYLTAGGTPMGDGNNFGTLLAGTLGITANGRLRVEPWDTTGPLPTPSGGGNDPNQFQEVNFIQIGDAGKALSGYDTLAYWWPFVGTFQVTYDPDGYLRLSTALRLRDSGYYVTTGGAALGALPLPWERPLPRSVTKPQYTRVTYDVVPVIGFNSLTGDFFTTDSPAMHASVASWSSVNPHTGGDAIDILHIVDDGVGKLTIGFPTFTSFCEYRLAEYLAAADTVDLTVDSAFPPGPTGRRIRIHAPDVGVDALYALVSYTQPLDYAASQWQLRWVCDV